MNSLIDYKEQVKALCDRSTAVIGKADMPEESAKLKRLTDEILAKTSPSLMFYGVYNAGKSSIINAIFGEDIAAVGDIPTTCEVQTIEWNNFRIIDTPGINAKNEHTLVAQNEINKNDVVLFVIADENIEEKSFYTAFVDVLKKDIQTVLVINQKNACYSLTESAEIHELTKRIIELIGIASKQAGIKTDISHNKSFHGIIPVNADIARNSQKISGDEAKALYEYSNLGELIETMQRVLDSSGGVKMLYPAITASEEALLAAAENIRERIESSSEKNYYNTLDRIKRQKENLYQRLISEGRICIARYKDMLLSYAGTGSSSEPDMSSLNKELNGILNKRFKEANIDLQNQFELYSIDSGMTKLKKTDFSIKIPEIESSNSEYDFFNELNVGTAVSAIGSLSPIKSIMPKTPEPTEIIIKSLPVLIAIIEKIVKGKKKAEEERRRKEEEMIRECERLNSEVQAQINEQIAVILEFNRKINSEMDKLEQSYNAVVTQNIELAYAPLFKTLEEQYEQLQQTAESTKGLLSEIDSILSGFGSLKAAIKA